MSAVMQDKRVGCIRKTSEKYCGDETRRFMFLWLSVYRALPAVWRLFGGCVCCMCEHVSVSLPVSLLAPFQSILVLAAHVIDHVSP